MAKFSAKAHSTNSKAFPWIKVLLLIACVIALVLLGLIFIGFFLFSGVSMPGSISLIPLKGEISSSDSIGSFSSDELVDEIINACNDSMVSAIVLDIDSGGGSVVPSKQIVYALRDCNKIIVSYIGEVGASGAYYAAASTDYIFADADSLIGSIGVISMVPNVEGLLEKLGIKMQVLTEGEFKDIGTPFREMTAEEKKIFESILAETYLGFKSDVLEFRKGKMNAAQFNAVSDGRILSGRQALKAKLIDEIGIKKDAIKKAAELAGIEGMPSVKKIGKQGFSLSDLFFASGKSFAQGFLSGIKSDSQNLSLK